MNVTLLIVTDPGDPVKGIRPYESRTYIEDPQAAETFRAAAELAGFKAETRSVDAKARRRATAHATRENEVSLRVPKPRREA